MKYESKFHDEGISVVSFISELRTQLNLDHFETLRKEYMKSSNNDENVEGTSLRMSSNDEVDIVIMLRVFMQLDLLSIASVYRFT